MMDTDELLQVLIQFVEKGRPMKRKRILNSDHISYYMVSDRLRTYTFSVDLCVIECYYL